MVSSLVTASSVQSLVQTSYTLEHYVSGDNCQADQPVYSGESPFSSLLTPSTTHPLAPHCPAPPQQHRLSDDDRGSEVSKIHLIVPFSPFL